MGHAENSRFRWAYESYGLSQASANEMTEPLDSYEKAEHILDLMEKDEEHTYTLYQMEGRT